MKVSAWLFGLSMLLSFGAIFAAVESRRQTDKLWQEVVKLREGEKRGGEAVAQTPKTAVPVPLTSTTTSAETPLVAKAPAASAGRTAGPLAIPDSSRPVAVAGPTPAFQGDAVQFKEKVKEAVTEIRKQEQTEQQKRRAEEQAQRMLRRLDRAAQELGLTEFQKQQVLKIWTDVNQKRQALWQQAQQNGDGPRDFSAGREQMQQIEQQAKEELKLVLSPVQYDALLKMEEEQRGGRRRGGDQPPQQQ